MTFIAMTAVPRRIGLVPRSVSAPQEQPADADAGDQHGAVFGGREVIKPIHEHTFELCQPATESVDDGK